jgi:hypothetical protein
LFSDCSSMSSFPAANTGSLDVQLYTRTALCRGRGEKATSRRKELDFWRSGQAKGHTDMRLTCGFPVVGCVWWHLKLFLAARRPPKTSFKPRRGRGIVFRNSRISLSAGRRACKPAAKPAIPGVILVHYGFVCYERTQGRSVDTGHWTRAPPPPSTGPGSGSREQRRFLSLDPIPSNLKVPKGSSASLVLVHYLMQHTTPAAAACVQPRAGAGAGPGPRNNNWQ